MKAGGKSEVRRGGMRELNEWRSVSRCMGRLHACVLEVEGERNDRQKKMREGEEWGG